MQVAQIHRDMARRRCIPCTRASRIRYTVAATYLSISMSVSWAYATDEAGNSVRLERLSTNELIHPTKPPSLVLNEDFAPTPKSQKPMEPFVGTIELGETRMLTQPADLKENNIHGRDPRLFPRTRIAFYSEDANLVPFTEEIIAAGSRGIGESYWDIIIQPGSVWSELGDHGWSRGGFPFALVNPLEGESHNGLATFAYRHGHITDVRIQIIQQTTPYYIAAFFTAEARIASHLAPADPGLLVRQRVANKASNSDRITIEPWNALTQEMGEERLRSFDDDKPMTDIVATGLDYNNIFYLKPCKTVAGPLPWCDRARFGVWSATKALVNEVVLLRIAQKYGAGVFEEKLAHYIPDMQKVPGWNDVRFEDAANMSTGMGNAPSTADGSNIEDGNGEKYPRWYEARTKQEKVEAAVMDARPYGWGAGRVARYRDQDIFLLGVAIDAYVKKKEGPRHSMWSMLVEEVFEPIGLRSPPIAKTIEAHERSGQPLAAFGFYPNLSDMVRIARLYQSLGAHNGRQILFAPQIQKILSHSVSPGHPTGLRSTFGESFYFNAFWETAYRSKAGCNFYYPQMMGYGGTVVALFPNQATGIRISRVEGQSNIRASQTSGMAQSAEAVKPFCPLY